MSKSVQIVLIAMLFIAVSCQKSEFENQELNQKLTTTNDYLFRINGESISKQTSKKIEEINNVLAGKGSDYRIVKAEYITMGIVENSNNTVTAKDLGNKRLDVDFVPNDSRRNWNKNFESKITYAIDHTSDIIPGGGILTKNEGINTIRKAFKVWDDVKSTNLNLTEVDALGKDIGVFAYANNSISASPVIFADIQVAGWGDIYFAPGVLAITYTFCFYDENGNLTDIDKNKKYDAAFMEIYFNPSYAWTNDGTGIDLESIAIHEIGHGLGQAHFGTTSIKNGEMKVTPRAVMNSYYLGPLRELQRSDLGGHNSIWANWPNN